MTNTKGKRSCVPFGDLGNVLYPSEYIRELLGHHFLVVVVVGYVLLAYTHILYREMLHGLEHIVAVVEFWQEAKLK